MEEGRQAQKAQGHHHHPPLLPVSGNSMGISKQEKKEGRGAEGPGRATPNGWYHTPV